MRANQFLFWQPDFDFLTLFQSQKFLKILLIFLNYFIWFFFFIVSIFLIKSDINIFWQLLLATILGEIIERFLKDKVYWKRPLYSHHHRTPDGLVDRWYETGSFPSGHTIKAVFFFLFIIQYPVFDPVLYLSIVLPLLIFRVLIGFHYPIDMFGGVIIGAIIWLLSFSVKIPMFINNFTKIIFDYVFGRF